MLSPRRLFHALKALVRRRSVEVEMDAEMQEHLALRIERNISAGMSAEEARAAAERAFGSYARIKERCRDEQRHGLVWLEQTLADFRYAARGLKKSPGFTAAAALTLALGIGVNAALFEVYDIMALRPLASRDPRSLVEVWGRNERAQRPIDPRFSYPDYLDYVAGSRTVGGIVAYRSMLVTLPDELSSVPDSLVELQPGTVTLTAVSGNYFSVLGGPIQIGRDFSAQEAGAYAGEPVMIVSDAFWRTHLHADAKVIGKTLSIQPGRGQPRRIYTIIGVAAPEFVGTSPLPPAAWVPLAAAFPGVNDRGSRSVGMVARVRPGASPGEAKADLDLIARRIAERFPASTRPGSVVLFPAMRIFNPKLSPGLAFLMSPVLIGFGLVLGVACLNVSNLLLARGVSRQREMGVRLSLGASRLRVARQLLTENLVLCGLGGVLALLFAAWTLQLLRPAAAALFSGHGAVSTMMRTISLGLDYRVAVFVGVLSLGAAFTAGLVPAITAARRDLNAVLKGGSWPGGTALAPSRLRNAFVVVQVAACLTLLATAGIMAIKAAALSGVKVGFAPENVLNVTVLRGSGEGATPVDRGELVAALDAVGTLPQVASSCLVAATPLRKAGTNMRSAFVRPAESGLAPELVSYNHVSAGFIDTFGIALRQGRFINRHDIEANSSVVVLTRVAAEQLWPGQSAIGKQLDVDSASMGRRPGESTSLSERAGYRRYEVIGVIADYRNEWSGEDRQPHLLFPLSPDGGATAYVRVDAASARAPGNIVRIARDAGVTLRVEGRLQSMLEFSALPFRLFAWISAVLAGLALVLAIIGLYGVIAFAVRQRVREIGIRMALGASSRAVTRLFVAQGMRMTLVGSVIGAAVGAVILTLITHIVTRGLVVESPIVRTAVFVLAFAILAVVALVACWLPARRASRVDPVVALRTE